MYINLYLLYLSMYVGMRKECVYRKLAVVDSNSARVNFLYGIKKPYLKKNFVYINKFRYIHY